MWKHYYKLHYTENDKKLIVISMCLRIQKIMDNNDENGGYCKMVVIYSFCNNVRSMVFLSWYALL